MPQDIIDEFQEQYGEEKGKRVFYATANKQNRDPETFKKKKDKKDKEKKALTNTDKLWLIKAANQLQIPKKKQVI